METTELTKEEKLQFDRELFKRSVVYNVKTLYRKELEEATPQQLFQAVSLSLKDQIVDNWMETQKAYDREDPKMVYYMSMEFLMGRALGNNIINLKATEPVKGALEELGIDLNLVEDQEPDAALGNGGLGRLAACFLDSLATLGYPAYGCGIRYRYGMFKQQIRDGYQVEVPDNWLADGNPFELRRPEYAKTVKFGGYVSMRSDENGRSYFVQEGYQAVKAVPFDVPIVGYGNSIVNTLRIWDAEPMEVFQLASFDMGDYRKAVEQENLARNIVEVLYPNDNHYAGKELRLKQQYFFISASFYKFLLKKKVVLVDPLRKITGPKNKKPLPSFLKENEMNRLLDDTDFGEGFEGCRDQLIIEMFYATGIRLSELIGLDDKDVDFSASLLKVTGKRNKQRLIPFGDELKEGMLEYVNVRNEQVLESGGAFFVRKNGERLYKNLVYNLVKRNLSKVVTLKKRSPHVLRHTFATTMLNNEAELGAVKELLGHSSLATTEIYTHTTFEELKKVYKQAHPRA